MISLATVTEVQQRAFEWAGMPAGWARVAGALALIGLCALVVWFYRWERRAGAAGSLRAFLAALRCLVLIGLAAVWLEPVIATYLVRSVSARVAVLVDVSASMSVADAGSSAPDSAPTSRSSTTRLQRVVDRLAANDGQWLRRLAARNELSLYAFGDQTVRLALPWDPAAAATLSTLEAAQPRTDLGQALTTVLDDIGDSPVAGVVVFSDGGLNQGLAVDELGALARRFRAALYTVGVGDPEEPPNVRITGLAAPALAPPGDPFAVRAELAASGIEPTEVEVELTMQPADAEQEVRVASQRIVVGRDPAPAAATFEVAPADPGEYVYRARVAPLPVEALTEDNVRETTVLVPKERLRVLIVAGSPSYEYQYLARLFERDRTLDVSCWLQSADARAVRDGRTVIRELPREPADVFAYDAILLLDPDPSELDTGWAVTMRRWVDEFGGGLLLQAGPHFTTRLFHDPRLQELVSILPVTPDPDADLRLSAQGTYRVEPTPFQLPEGAVSHPLMELGTAAPSPSRPGSDAAATSELWRALPGVWWYLPVLRAKPVATVLLEHAGLAQRNQYGPAVLMAVQPVGAGRVGFLGFNTTWRWRGRAEAYFNRFWVQLARYLAHARRQETSRRGTLTLDRESFYVGDYVRIEAHRFDAAYAPAREPQVPATLTWGDGRTQDFVLTAAVGREGWFEGRLLLERAGPAMLRVPLPGAVEAGGQEGPEFLTRRIRVQRPDLELRGLRLREEVLLPLAEQTHGEYCRLSTADHLPDQIRKATERKPPQRTAVEALWDRAWVLGALAALLSLEWALRRRHHLL